MNTHGAMKGHVLAKVHPSFLKTNAQNHRWPFSAVAELIDNAYDPDVSADVLKIQKEDKNGKRCLVFQDNGNGMDLDHLIKMLSFGFCEKKKFMDQPNSHTPIGQYGNGFKSGSMRLAMDALVFTVHKQSETACVGMLSQTFCQQRHIDSLVFPMMEFIRSSLERSKADMDMDTALEAILDVSPYNSEEELKNELSSLRKEKRRGGTKIVLFNLSRGDNGETELDFESDPVDIRNPGDVENQLDSDQQPKTYGYRQSLRRYCSILFRDVKMKIQINGKEVETFYFLGDLKEIKDTYYKPKRKDLKGKKVDITFGKEKKTGSGKLEDHGVMFYHRNRLIMPYVKLPCQKKDVGLDVVGIVDVTDLLTPINNKQGFDVNTAEYTSLINALSKKLEKYCENEDLDEGEEDEKEPCCDIDEEDHSQESDMPGPIRKAKRKSTSGNPTPTKRARTSSATPQSEPSTSSDVIEGLRTRTTTRVPSGPRPQSSATPSSTSPAPSCRPPAPVIREPALHDGSRAAPDRVPREQQGSFQRNVQRLLNYLHAKKWVPKQNSGNVEQNIKRVLRSLRLKVE